ncbi:hypothetical protein [Planktothricoides raciborskii]|uniref:DUF2079 domain-containing protein n=1 Tax=Planktothricoides raciborskii GIHE-MW2 TaxID=2792601 RepID=A0AAU8J839_9CYAN
MLLSPETPKNQTISDYPGIPAKLALLFATYTIIVALLFLYFRQYDPEIFRQVRGIIAYPLALFGSVALSSHYRKNLWMLPICVLGFMFLPFAIAPIGGWLLLPLAILGIALIIYSGVQSKIFKSVYELIGIFAAGIFLGVFYFFVTNGMNYAHLFSDIAAYTNLVHKDTLFHSAIINMIARFGTPSTGLDGVIPLAYHVGIHRWVAANSLMLGGDTPILLGISQQIALLPAFFFVTTLTVYHLSAGQVSVLTLVAFTFGFIWLGGLVDFLSYVAGESYAFSLPIFIAMVPIGISWLQRSIQKSLFKVVKHWEWVVAIAAIAACWSAKMSTGLMLIIYLFVCIFVPKVLQDLKRYLSIVIPTIIFGVISLYGIKKIYLNSIYNFFPFHYALTWPSFFISQVVLFTLLISAIWLISGQGEKSFRYSIAIVLIFTFLSSQVPGLLLAIGGASAGYFIIPVLMMTLVICAALLIDVFGIPQFEAIELVINWQNQTRQKLAVSAHQWKQVKRPIGYTALMLIFILTLRFSYLPLIVNVGALLKQVDQVYLDPNQGISYTYSIRERVTRLLMATPKIDRKKLIAETPLGKIKDLVDNLDPEIKDLTLLYITPSYEAFWEPQQKADGRSCWDQPLVVTAVIGLPLLNGVRSGVENCEVTLYYGMADYGSESLNQDLSQQELCTKAEKLGFRQVYKISENKHKLYRCQS